MVDNMSLDKLVDIVDKIFVIYDQGVSTLLWIQQNQHTASRKGIVRPAETGTADATTPNTHIQADHAIKTITIAEMVVTTVSAETAN